MILKNLKMLIKKLGEPKYIYLVIITVILTSIYVIGTTNSAQTLLEGLENQNADKNDSANSTGTKLTNYSSDIKKNNEYMNDVFLVSKYKKDFENFIMNLEEYSNNLMIYKLFSVAEQSKKYKVDDNVSINQFVIPEMEKVNNIRNFIESLNSTFKYLDRKKN